MIKFPGWRAQNNEGPPDLDEVMRDLSRKINTLFVLQCDDSKLSKWARITSISVERDYWQ